MVFHPLVASFRSVWKVWVSEFCLCVGAGRGSLRGGLRTIPSSCGPKKKFCKSPVSEMELLEALLATFETVKPTLFGSLFLLFPSKPAQSSC